MSQSLCLDKRTHKVSMQNLNIDYPHLSNTGKQEYTQTLMLNFYNHKEMPIYRIFQIV